MVAIRRLVQRRSAITSVLGAVATILVLAHIGLQLVEYRTGHDYIFGLIPLFDVNGEQNIPTLFSALLLLFAAALLASISKHARQQGTRDVSKWTMLAVGFLYMAIDEYGQIHEMLVVPGRSLLGDRPLGIFYYAWVIPGVAVVLILAVFFLSFLLRLPARTRLAFVVAAMLFVGGAIGIELLEGLYDEPRGREAYGVQDLTNVMLTTVQESLEMAGVIIFIGALLKYMNDNHVDARQFDAGISVQAAAASQPVQAGGPAPASAPVHFSTQPAEHIGRQR